MTTYTTTTTEINEHETVVRTWRIESDGTEVLIAEMLVVEDAYGLASVTAQPVDIR